jgi:hypothetical protein
VGAGDTGVDFHREEFPDTIESKNITLLPRNRMLRDFASAGKSASNNRNTMEKYLLIGSFGGTRQGFFSDMEPLSPLKPDPIAPFMNSMIPDQNGRIISSQSDDASAIPVQVAV